MLLRHMMHGHLTLMHEHGCTNEMSVFVEYISATTRNYSVRI